MKSRSLIASLCLSASALVLACPTLAQPSTRGAFEFSGRSVDASVTVNNLLDKNPPPSPSRVGVHTSILQAKPTLCDIMGRYVTVGLQFRL